MRVGTLVPSADEFEADAISNGDGVCYMEGSPCDTCLIVVLVPCDFDEEGDEDASDKVVIEWVILKLTLIVTGDTLDDSFDVQVMSGDWSALIMEWKSKRFKSAVLWILKLSGTGWINSNSLRKHEISV